MYYCHQKLSKYQSVGGVWITMRVYSSAENNFKFSSVSITETFYPFLKSYARYILVRVTPAT